MTSSGFGLAGASMAVSAVLLDIKFSPKGYQVIFKYLSEMQID
jgi:hypothetical protein